jgi:arginyl-tRNA synthetase
MRIEATLDALAAQAIQEALDVEAPPILRPTSDPKLGDYQINGAMGLAKRLKQNPKGLAAKIAEALRGKEAIAEATVAGPGFVNLRLDEGWIAKVLDGAVADVERDGVPAVDAPETVVIDFSSPNVAKELHVGHLRSTVIGESLRRLLTFCGHRVIGDNHLGDWGTQFGLLIVGMREIGDDAALEAKPLDELERVYKAASARAKDDEAFAEEARRELAKLQAGDPANHALWERFIAITREALDAIYARLDVHFDEWLGESFYNPKLAGVVDRLIEAGLAREDQGAICVFFNELEGAPKALKKQKAPFIVRKKDGAFNYATTDIATLFHRKAHFAADRCLYVVDSRQGLHFRMLFALADMLGLGMRLEHVDFGMMLGAGGKPLKTRDGGTIKLAALLDEAEERAKAKMMEAPLSLTEEMATSLAPAVGIGAVKYADLGQKRSSDYTFDWEKLISFQGDAGPYLQYAHARCCSIFRKAELDRADVRTGRVVLVEEAERALARRLLRFADVVHQGAEQAYPHFISEHLYRLARQFMVFYEQCPVLSAEGELRASRLALVDLTARQLARGLDLLGIAAPERM